MATTQLSLYNGALALIKERSLVTLTDNNESRRQLDRAWDGAIDACLEQGLWNFSIRTAKFTKEGAFTATFGYKNQFAKPADFIRIVAVCNDEYFNAPLTQYTDEAGYWYSDLDDIYVSYVSNAATYGSQLSRWPQSFVGVVEAYLAMKIAPRVAGTDDDSYMKKFRLALVDARSKDAMNEPTKFMPQGSWSAARSGGVRRDRGSRGQLIG